MLVWGVTRWDEQRGTWDSQYLPVWAKEPEFIEPDDFLGWLELPTEFKPIATAPNRQVWVTDGKDQGVGERNSTGSGWEISHVGDDVRRPYPAPTGWAALPAIPGVSRTAEPRAHTPISGAEFDTRCRLLGMSIEEASAIFGLGVEAIQEAVAENATLHGSIGARLADIEDAMDEDVEGIVWSLHEDHANPVTLWRFRDKEHMMRSALTLPPEALGLHVMTVARMAFYLTQLGHDVSIDFQIDTPVVDLTEIKAGVVWTPSLF